MSDFCRLIISGGGIDRNELRRRILVAPSQFQDCIGNGDNDSQNKTAQQLFAELAKISGGVVFQETENDEAELKECERGWHGVSNLS